MQKKKKEPKKHHYIQQSYLKGFQHGNKKVPQIFVYTKENPLKEPYISAIKDTACEKDFHKIKVEDSYDRTTVEELLSMIESEVIQNIHKVIDSKQILDKNKELLAIMILLMKARVPQNVNALKRQFERLLEYIAEITFSQNNTGLSGTFKDNFKIIVNNNYPIFQMLKSVLNEKLISQIMNMNFSLVKVPVGSFFVCSDAPVSYYCKPYSGRGVGLSHPNLEIFLPLDKDFGLICTRKNVPPYKELSKEDVASLNRRTVITSEKYIFSPIKDDCINELIEKNKDYFSGIRYLESLNDGLLQYSDYIPVTD